MNTAQVIRCPTGSANNWWLRSANSSSNFVYVNNNGNGNNNGPNNTNGVAAGFSPPDKVSATPKSARRERRSA